jgi:O-methyltransferase involved in polyketide biosynthesis
MKADDVYMGFASRAEIAAFLKELEAAERTGRPHADMLRRMLSQDPRRRPAPRTQRQAQAQESVRIKDLASG